MENIIVKLIKNLSNRGLIINIFCKKFKILWNSISRLKNLKASKLIKIPRKFIFNYRVGVTMIPNYNLFIINTI